MLGSGFIIQAEITHLSLSQQCAVHLNTIIRRVIYRLSDSKLPYFSCGRQVSSSEQHLPSEKGPNYLSTASVWQDSSWATAREGDKADTWTAMTSISLGHWFFKKKKGNRDDYLRINNHVSACQQIIGTFRRQGLKQRLGIFQRMDHASSRLDLIMKWQQKQTTSEVLEQ